MSADFYFRKGLRFWQWHERMRSAFEFEIDPVGAPLGDEITKNSNFDDAGCGISLHLPQLTSSLHGHFGFQSLRDAEWNKELHAKWNPEGDSLIHYVSIGFDDVELIPTRYRAWPEWMPMSVHVYQFYKMMFIALECDEAECIPDEFSRVFRWDRHAVRQQVILPYEEGHELTEQIFKAGIWQGERDTKAVFPALSRGMGGGWGQAT